MKESEYNDEKPLGPVQKFCNRVCLMSLLQLAFPSHRFTVIFSLQSLVYKVLHGRFYLALPSIVTTYRHKVGKGLAIALREGRNDLTVSIGSIFNECVQRQTPVHDETSLILPTTPLHRCKTSP